MTSSSRRMIVLAAGGTGGHMFPAEALAGEMRSRGWRVVLATDKRGLRFAENFPCERHFLISAGTPSIGGPIAKGAAAFSIIRGVLDALGEYRHDKPDFAVGFGGYPSLPAMKAASFSGISYGVHEQNGVLGRSNRLLARSASFVAHGFPLLERTPGGVYTIETGNPVRQTVLDAAAAPLAIDEGSPIKLLIFGGSQGASLFSAAPTEAISRLPDELRARLSVTHQARADDLEQIRNAYANAGVAHTAEPFFDDLPRRMAASDLVLARAGASTVTELGIIGRPSILVPLKIAMDDHQLGNARVLEERGAARLIPEDDFSADTFRREIAALLSDPAALQKMAIAAKGSVMMNATETLADLVEETVDQKLAA
ncbi:MAG: UDP-N-acetylglucosamine--N-acetylmuramyl-(pentapeptide) pyrophosphoryl-undecaprenol N-acetylglucosamine transferase [Pseudomonadota bacterium]